MGYEKDEWKRKREVPWAVVKEERVFDISSLNLYNGSSARL